MINFYLFYFIYLVALPGVAGEGQKADDSIWCPTAAGGSQQEAFISVALIGCRWHGLVLTLPVYVCVGVCRAATREIRWKSLSEVTRLAGGGTAAPWDLCVCVCRVCGEFAFDTPKQ
jgi:hypothetical protein